MRFKDFTDIDSLKHKQIEEKPVKNYTGDFKELSIAKPSSNTSKKTVAEMKTLQGMFDKRTKQIEQSVRDHDNKVEFAVEKYLKENNLQLDKKNTDKIA